jgi:hypothetical protein
MEILTVVVEGVFVVLALVLGWRPLPVNPPRRRSNVR